MAAKKPANTDSLPTIEPLDKAKFDEICSGITANTSVLVRAEMVARAEQAFGMDRDPEDESATVARFIALICRATGLEKRAIQYDRQIVKEISPKARALIRGKPLANRTRLLLRLCELKDDSKQQLALAKMAGDLPKFQKALPVLPPQEPKADIPFEPVRKRIEFDKEVELPIGNRKYLATLTREGREMILIIESVSRGNTTDSGEPLDTQKSTVSDNITNDDTNNEPSSGAAGESPVDHEKLFIDRLRRAPNRQWAEGFLELISTVVNLDGVGPNDPRIAATVPVNVADVNIFVGTRSVLSALDTREPRISLLLPYDFDASSLPFKTTPEKSYAKRKDEAKAPLKVAFEVTSPIDLLPVVREAWFEQIAAELEAGGEKSKQRGLHNRSVISTACDLEVRQRILDEIFEPTGEPKRRRRAKK